MAARSASSSAPRSTNSTDPANASSRSCATATATVVLPTPPEPTMVTDADLAAISLASMLGLSVQSEDPIPGLIAYLRDKKILLILDNCEHIIEAAASLAERVFLAAPQVHILATSRESLRVQGERVHRLAPLSFPPDDAGLTAAIALTFPAIQLFLERA